MHFHKRSILVSLLMLTSLIIRKTNASENYWATDGNSSGGFEIFSVNSLMDQELRMVLFKFQIQILLMIPMIFMEVRMKC